ncbi:MAG: ATP-binding cassette domain-containing protein [Roseburia sp.]|nr:ATP-binding cassette domain-containing protein [Anaeroplasma bactoclasticum]MCM1195741.1 ATP-binding cassette domain-containing protein [Roseburia sp.]MCM1557662.1 ATP-binding cassette domain-containing protein [Anaeroplasma bactoclasticum]
MVITFDNVTFKYIDKMLLDHASFSVTDQDKVGIIGVNGTGKTTLLKLILGMEKPISGTIIKSGGMLVNYLPQDPIFEEGVSLIDIVMKDSTKEHPIADYEAKSILSKLGFTDYNMTATHFSGGQKKRLALAKVLVTYCDFLILDEPTNHLDNEMILWLEKYLMKFKKGLLMVTHDRYFLQRACNKMLELDYGKVYLYDANYDLFLDLKAERLENEKKEQQKLKSILKKEAEWMHRGVEARRTKSKSRIERFEKMREISFHETKEMAFSSKESYLGKTIIEMKNGAKAYGNLELFSNVSFSLKRNDVIGIVGDNGAGKTTLFKILMREEKLDDGELTLGETLKIGYFSQNADWIDLNMRVIDYIKEEQSLIETLDGNITASELLERFLFDSTLQYSKVKMLSGGEKRRLQLVRVLMKNPNVLLLDEPTNDLDIYTIEILEDYIESFKGPVLVVSHDRYFLDKICNLLLVYENKTIHPYLLSFSEFLEQLQSQKNTTSISKGVKPKENKFPAKLRNEQLKLEEDIKLYENKLKEISLAMETLTTDYVKLMEKENAKKDIEIKLDTAITRLFEIEEIKEQYK